MSNSLPVINIKAKATHHGLFLILLSAVLAGITLLLHPIYWEQYRISVIFLYLVALVIAIIGIFKRTEPKFSLCISPLKIEYYHRYGQWTISWQQIKKINTVTESVGLSLVELPYIGICLKNVDCLAEQISPRLANRLIHEQKTLLSFAFRQKLLSQDDIELCFEPFILATGEIINGPIAAFLHHSQKLQQSLGYHLYIPETTLDRDLQDFNQLLSQLNSKQANIN